MRHFLSLLLFPSKNQSGGVRKELETMPSSLENTSFLLMPSGSNHSDLYQSVEFRPTPRVVQQQTCARKRTLPSPVTAPIEQRSPRRASTTS